MTQIPVRNPHTGDIDYAFEELTKSELASKISRLRKNQVDWSSLEVSDRGEILTQFADGLARHKINWHRLSVSIPAVGAYR